MPLNSEALKEARVRSGLTQDQAADILKVTRQTISRWETGKTYPSIDLLADISDVYGIPLEVLFDKEMHGVEDLPRIVLSSRYSVWAMGILAILGFFGHKLTQWTGLVIGDIVTVLTTVCLLSLIGWEFYWGTYGRHQYYLRKSDAQRQKNKDE